VLEKETKVSKGVGYVTFAMKEDAAACVEKGKVEMNGRNLRVSWAGAKVRLYTTSIPSVLRVVYFQPKPGEASPIKTEKPLKQLNITPRPKPQEKDLEAMRTVTISGLPDGITSKVLWKKVRKQEGAESLVYPLIQTNGTEDATQADVVFTTSVQAQRGIEHLNAHIFKGSLLGATLKKRLEKKPTRASRLIIRNLPWDTTEAELRALFIPYGSVYSVEIPTTPSGQDGKKPRAKGFAFVWMLTKSDAETAIEKVNGQKVKDRPIAVDWALSKSKWENENEKIGNVVEEEDEDRAEDSESASGSGSDDGETGDEDEDEEMESGGLGVHSEQDVSMHSAGEEDEDEEDEDDRGVPAKPELPAPEAGTTLFIRNVPWEATEDELQQA
jgi:nucleolar protein 4